MNKKKRNVAPFQRKDREGWFADIPTPGGRRQRVNLGKDEQKAHAKLHQELANYYDDEDVKTVGNFNSSPFYLSLVSRFLKWNKANRSPATYDMYKYGFKRINNWFSKDHLLRLRADDITPTIIEDVKNELITKGKSAETINKTVRSIKRLYRWAVKQRLIEDNPVVGVEKVGRYVNAPDRPKSKAMSFDQAMRYVEICSASPPLGEFCEFLLLTGVRISEATDMRWGDIDFEQQIFTLAKHKTSERTGQPRQVPLCKRAIKIINNQKTNDTNPDTHVFLGKKGQPFTSSALQCRLQRLRKKQPELRSFNFHHMRHTCNSLLAMQDVPEWMREEILGHTSSAMTRLYTTINVANKVEVMERLSYLALKKK